MASKLDDISEAIGSLRAEVRMLTESNKRADDQRATVHRRVDDLVDEIGGLKTDIATVKQDLGAVKGETAELRAVTDDVARLRTQAVGAGTAGRLLIKFGIGIVSFAGWAVGLYTWLTGRPPP